MDLDNKEDELEFVDILFEYVMEYYISYKVDLTEFLCYVALKNGFQLDEDKVRETIQNGEIIIN